MYKKKNNNRKYQIMFVYYVLNNSGYNIYRIHHSYYKQESYRYNCVIHKNKKMKLFRYSVYFF